MRQNPFKVEMTMIPKGPSGRAVGLTNNASYLARGAKAPEAAWLFYKHLIGKDVQPQMARLGGGRYTASKKLKPTVALPLRGRRGLRGPAAISRPMPLIASQADLDREWRQVWEEMSEGKKGVREGLPPGAGAGHAAAEGWGLPVLTVAPARRRCAGGAGGRPLAGGAGHLRPLRRLAGAQRRDQRRALPLPPPAPAARADRLRPGPALDRARPLRRLRRRRRRAVQGAADGYAVFFIASVHYSRATFALGGALDPCYTLYREHNPGDDSLDEAAHALYRRLLEFRTEPATTSTPATATSPARTARPAAANDAPGGGRRLLQRPERRRARPAGYHQPLQDDRGALEHALGMAATSCASPAPGRSTASGAAPSAPG